MLENANLLARQDMLTHLPIYVVQVVQIVDMEILQPRNVFKHALQDITEMLQDIASTTAAPTIGQQIISLGIVKLNAQMEPGSITSNVLTSVHLGFMDTLLTENATLF